MGLPPLYDVCIRWGELDTEQQLLYADLGSLAGWCKKFVFHHESEPLRAAQATAIAKATHRAQLPVPARRWRAAAQSDTARPGEPGFTIITVDRGSVPAAEEAAFAFVNKTPPASPELFTSYCIEDMAGCDWHRGVELSAGECRHC